MKKRKCVHTIFFDIRGYIEISVFEITELATSIMQSSIQDQISADFQASCLILKKHILTVTAQSNHFLHSKAINKHFSGGNLYELEPLK